jgi:hypothetical protein
MYFNRWRAGKQILSLLRATRNVVFETQFDNLQEFVNSLFPVRLHPPPPPPPPPPIHTALTRVTLCARY